MTRYARVAATSLAALLAWGADTALWAQPYDLIIRGGRLVDGTGAPSRLADVAIAGDRIAAVGQVTGETLEVLEATGRVVAPGFIDVHTHADEVDEQPLAENFVRMGVATIVAGNCGSSVRDVGGLFQRLERRGAAVNVATLVGHGTVRAQAMGGSHDRPPTPRELARMRHLVDEAMKEGACGLSTGLIYPPGSFAQTAELIEVAKVAAAHGGIYASHMRSEGDRIFAALEEVFAVAKEAHLPAQVSHLKLAGPANWGQPDKVLAAIDRARADGLEITQDQYLYTASSTGLSQLLPDWALEGGKFKARLADPAQKTRMTAFMKQRLEQGQRGDYSYVMIADYAHDPSLNGLRVPEAARQKRGAATLDDQIELILEIQSRGGASGVFHGISEADLRVFLGHPQTMFACDSGLRKLGEGMPHPRGYGNSARVLARYVRELKLLTLEEAIRRMTSLPARTFRFADRGEVRVGAWADLVVFNPEEIRDNATFEKPHQYATGFVRVFVNGKLVVKDDVHTGARPGKPLRHPAAPLPNPGL